MLYQGIFWIIDKDNLEKNASYCYKIVSDSDGNVLENAAALPLNAKSGKTYNHKLTWDEMPKELTGGKPFDYYPRGRVQIANNKAIIYLNPTINTDDAQAFIKETFELSKENGINKIVFKSDGSNHYKAYVSEDK